MRYAIRRGPCAERHDLNHPEKLVILILWFADVQYYETSGKYFTYGAFDFFSQALPYENGVYPPLSSAAGH